MAQGQVSLPHAANGAGVRVLAEDKELYEIEQYDRILRFRDAILSGSHPTIKVPSGLIPAVPSSASASKEPPVVSGPSKGLAKFPANPKKPNTVSHVVASYNTTVAPSLPNPPVSIIPDINPIFLEKSDELIKAELQIQRQRLERTLRDEVEQRRNTKQAQTEQADQPSELDLSDILAKALILVQATSALVTDETLPANKEAASDSFDDTYYSSRHDTPESPMISRVRNESEEAEEPYVPSLDQSSIPQPAVTSRNEPTIRVPGLSAIEGVSPYRTQHVQPPAGPAHVSLVPGLNNYVAAGTSASITSHKAAQGQASSTDHSQAAGRQSGAANATRGHPRQDDTYADTHPPSPLIRSHDLMPVAPQPVQVSPLVEVERVPPHIQQHRTEPAVGTPAQVAALRNEPTTITSPESSSQNGRASEKKKGKKKKRKADRQAPESELPYIKPEPRSVSPVAAPSYLRPNKRQRHAPAQVTDPAYAAAGYESAAPPGLYPTQPYRDERVPVGYEVAPVYPPRPASTAAVGGPRYAAEYVDGSRIAGGAYIRHHPESVAPPFQYASREGHPRAVSQVLVHDPYRDVPQYRPVHEGHRLSVRPEGDSYMGPPNPQPTRIVVDAYGREYIEPPRPAMRSSVAPSARPAEQEIIYERAPPRPIHGYPAPGSYEDPGMIYAAPPGSYIMPRRYVTQPEYIQQDYRDREYSTRPTPSGEFVQVIPPQDRRPLEEPLRDYAGRPISTRPVEAVRYEASIPDYGRVPSVRPEAALREYQASVHPESRPQVLQPYTGYGGQPVRQPTARQEYGMARPPVERYHEPQGRPAEDIAFIERPRGATQDIVYADDARREVYRGV